MDTDQMLCNGQVKEVCFTWGGDIPHKGALFNLYNKELAIPGLPEDFVGERLLDLSVSLDSLSLDYFGERKGEFGEEYGFNDPDVMSEEEMKLTLSGAGFWIGLNRQAIRLEFEKGFTNKLGEKGTYAYANRVLDFFVGFVENKENYLK